MRLVGRGELRGNETYVKENRNIFLTRFDALKFLNEVKCRQSGR